MCEVISATIGSLLASSAAAGGTAAAGVGAAAAASPFLMAAAPLSATAVGFGGAGLSVGSVLSAVGAAAGIGGTLLGGVAQAKQMGAQADALEQQAAAERALAAVEDDRTRRMLRAETARLMTGVAGRGVMLDSPSAIGLAEEAAREASFTSQSVRSGGAARSGTLSAQSRQSRALARGALFGGGLGAAGRFLTAAPDLWPGLADRRILA